MVCSPLYTQAVLKHMYINRRFCYANKLVILTKRIRIVRNIVFLNDNFKEEYLGLAVDLYSELSEEDTINDFLKKYSIIKVQRIVELKVCPEF